MANTLLVVPFAQKDKAKALGARWDADQRQWFVPAGMDIAPFEAWLPAERIPDSDSRERGPNEAITPTTEPAGVSLSQLLAGVDRAVAQAYREGVWTRVDVVNATVKNRHVYLELSERNEEGAVVAQARGTIWARTADRIVPEFERASGAQLAPGIKLLVLAKPVFNAQYGFSLDITSIDASYTVGDLEAQKRRIREQLREEQIFDGNRQLTWPWDFRRVLVVAPRAGAGLGDFEVEAKRLHLGGVCEFIYAYSRFQGNGASAEIVATMEGALRQGGSQPWDALIIIRGGGAVNDLAWLNDYQLARFICTCDYPVFTGIGHKKDSTILDEVALRSFDTPSKVIAAIESHIAQRTREASDAYERIMLHARRDIERALAAGEHLDAEIRAAAQATVATARGAGAAAIHQVQMMAAAQINRARQRNEMCIREIREDARTTLRQAKHEAPAAMSTIRELSTATVRSLRSEVRGLLPAVLEQSGAHIVRARRGLEVERQGLFERAQVSVTTARSTSEALVREVVAQGPKKTLARGFAVVKGRDGKPVTTVHGAKQAGSMDVTFNDGIVRARVEPDGK
ncbi:exodeoxyribonuclease VII large subunit [Caenimonas sedimenti]|uniref:Exodeoxyribonuclease VII large subunit n=1 Tax=Caenimonas sedimenti TaxID=2596921 RepID=A0A562ZSG3_9BURK|nr:exodeoxyribonuclease VII large subunit [Caenimonas sedimenti]TWO71530.1 exodeoxyribonuclease VII large subunit [Caenimonas sedimenti]